MIQYADNWKKNLWQHRKSLGGVCYVCGSDWKKKGLRIDRHHLRYDNMGKEKAYRDIVLLCERHHLKGMISLDSLKRWRSSYRFEKYAILLTLLPFKVVWWLLRHLVRIIQNAVLSVLKFAQVSDR